MGMRKNKKAGYTDMMNETPLADAVPLMRDFRVARYWLVLVAKERLFMPAYKGSTFRGGFGSVFRRITCSQRGQECAPCLLRDACPYSYIFETAPPQGSEALRNYQAVPRPFVIEPSLDKKQVYEPGEELDFHLVLVGRAIEYLPYFVVVFRELGDIGLGKGRGKFELTRIEAASVASAGMTGAASANAAALVYTGEDGTVHNVEASITWEDVVRLRRQRLGADADGNPRQVAINFETMTRLVYHEGLVGKPEFHIFFRNLLRRTSSLAYFHHGKPLDVDFKALIADAETVRLSANDTRWVDWERYSNRQGTKMAMGGLVGTVVYEGELTRFLPWLYLGEYVHVGKGATFGLGKYTLV